MTMLGRACIALLAVVALTGCGEIDRPVVVGAKDFAEQKITAQLLAQTLRAHEIPVEVEDTARTSLDAIGALWAGDLRCLSKYLSPRPVRSISICE
jgi:glycine betaine/choline ABC-type transport system substrate-binding protein